MRHADEHPHWCARDHRCNLGEHRAEPVTLAVAGRGVLVLTRVRAADGRQHVEIRTRVVLATGEAPARAQLARILTLLDALLRHLIRLPR
jgi:hypothetical protein